MSLQVTIIGDGTREEVVLTGSRLNDSSDLMSRANGLPMPRGIRRSSAFLRQQLHRYDLCAATCTFHLV